MKSKKKAVAKKRTTKAAGRTTGAPKKSVAGKKVAPIPAGYHTVTPYLVCRGASDAIAFYKSAFGAKELLRLPGPDGKLAHAEIRIGDSHLMLGDEAPDMGALAPPTVGGTPVHIFLYVPKVDAVFQRAIAAGATVEMPPTNMFWGDRYCKLSDPFGHKWSMATHIEDVSPKEMARRSTQEMTKMAEPAAV